MALELVDVLGYDNYLISHYNNPLLGEEDKRRRDRRTPRIAIKRYSQSAFMYLYLLGNDQALLNCCGVDHIVFRELLDIFEPCFNSYTIDKNTGSIRKFKEYNKHNYIRHREFDAAGCLALILFWFQTRGSAARAVAIAFGITASPMYRWLKFGRKVLLTALQDHPAAKVCLPNEQETQQYIDAIAAKYPSLCPHRVWAACDGLKLHLQQSGDWTKQNQYYNGWTCGTYVNSVFLFCPDGRIRACVLSCPGSWHDSTQAKYGLYEKMERMYELETCFALSNGPEVDAAGFPMSPALRRDDSIVPITNASVRTLWKVASRTFALPVLLILLCGKAYHFRSFMELSFPESITFEYGTIGQHISSPSPRLDFPPMPSLSQNETFGACLLVKGDNDLLTEWIAYHYAVLPLRHILVLSDAGNPENPTTVLKKWTAANTDLQWWVMDSSLVQDMYGEFDEESARRGYENTLKKRGRLSTTDTYDPDLIRFIAHARLIEKQKAIITHCTAFMKNRGIHWVSLYDTDEFLAINRMGMHEATEPKNATTAGIDITSAPGEDEPFDEIYGMRPNLPGRESNVTVVDIINFFHNMNRPLKPCHTIPRVSFGAAENFTCPGSEDVKEFAKENFDFGIFSTLRFQQHAVKEDFSKNRFGKVFLDVSNISDATLSMKPKNIHRPFPNECIRPIPVFKQSPFYLMHFSGGWERFKAKNDARRGFEQWKTLADVKDSVSCCEEENHRWLPRFVDQVGLERAKYLLGRTARRNPGNFSS
eukprot:jgi/Psemu1/63698/estExt_Genemark1.C_340067